ncbi:MAG: hypothetical protein HY067_00605 [Betaproteobacteria bacterium]|nr:hypothetical protein [Betaproteobacteria bacterium]
MSSKIEPVSRPLQTRWYKVALLVAGVIAYQVLVYRTIVDNPDGFLGEGLMVAPLLVVLGCVLGRNRRGRLLLAAFAVFGVIGFLLWRAVGANPALFYPVPYLTVYALLLWLFGRTLSPGRQPLVTRLATHVHGELPPEIAGYTRRVTWAWCGFFAGMALTSMLLFLFEPLSIWSVFNNLLNLPLVVAMYLGEYAWRLWRFPNFSHASIATVFRAFRNFDFNRPAAGR